MPFNVHLTLQADIKKGKSDTALFRQLCKSLITDTMLWAHRNHELMESDFEIILACRGKPRIVK